eukprot:gene4340-8637_t
MAIDVIVINFDIVIVVIVIRLEAIASEIPEIVMKEALHLAQTGVRDVISDQIHDLQEHYAKVVSINNATVPVITGDDTVPNIVTAQEPGPNFGNVESVVMQNRSTWKKTASVPDGLQEKSDSIGFDRALDLFLHTPSRVERTRGEGRLRAEILKELGLSDEGQGQRALILSHVAEKTMSRAFRQVVLDGHRADGRSHGETRSLGGATGVLPVLHGSSFFMRGDTHVLCTTTLGSRTDNKVFLPISGGPEKAQNFFLHYDFPPYCTGEVGNATALNRRMVGHGNLAEKALRPVMPDSSDFPYTCRVFAESTSSNGSTSMASVCGASLALMDAGVPIMSAVAGVSIGLVSREGTVTTPSPPIPKLTLDNNNSNKTSDIVQNPNPTCHSEVNSKDWVLLTDIFGSEDHYGDMDFKIAGSTKGVTAIQLDVKLPLGIPLSVLESALDRAAEARNHILLHMNNVISTPRPALKHTAPRAELIRFDPERLRHLVGPGGEMIRYIEKTYDCKIDTSEEGVAYIFGAEEQSVLGARLLVQDLVTDIVSGAVYTAEVAEVKDFGALVRLTRSQEALLHISEVSHDPQLLRKPMHDLLSVGQRLEVKVLHVDRGTGQIKVSRRELLDKITSVPDQISAVTVSVTSSPVTAQSDVSSSLSLSSVKGPSSLSPSPSLYSPLPTFPVIPPRRWDIGFFRSNVADTTSPSTKKTTAANNNTSTTTNNTIASNKYSKNVIGEANNTHDAVPVLVATATTTTIPLPPSDVMDGTGTGMVQQQMDIIELLESSEGALASSSPSAGSDPSLSSSSRSTKTKSRRTRDGTGTGTGAMEGKKVPGVVLSMEDKLSSSSSIKSKSDGSGRLSTKKQQPVVETKKDSVSDSVSVNNNDGKQPPPLPSVGKRMWSPSLSPVLSREQGEPVMGGVDHNHHHHHHIIDPQLSSYPQTNIDVSSSLSSFSISDEHNHINNYHHKYDEESLPTEPTDTVTETETSTIPLSTLMKLTPLAESTRTHSSYHPNTPRAYSDQYQHNHNMDNLLELELMMDNDRQTKNHAVDEVFKKLDTLGLRDEDNDNENDNDKLTREFRKLTEETGLVFLGPNDSDSGPSGKSSVIDGMTVPHGYNNNNVTEQGQGRAEKEEGEEKEDDEFYGDGYRVTFDSDPEDKTQKR